MTIEERFCDLSHKQKGKNNLSKILDIIDLSADVILIALSVFYTISLFLNYSFCF